MANKEPRWTNDPPPGFKPDGTSMIVPSIKDIPPPNEKIKVGDKLYTPEEFEKLEAQQAEEEDDLSDLDDIAALADA